MPAKTKKVLVSLKVPRDLLKQIDVVAAANDMSRSQWFRHLARKDIAGSARTPVSGVGETEKEAA